MCTMNVQSRAKQKEEEVIEDEEQVDLVDISALEQAGITVKNYKLLVSILSKLLLTLHYGTKEIIAKVYPKLKLKRSFV